MLLDFVFCDAYADDSIIITNILAINNSSRRPKEHLQCDYDFIKGAIGRTASGAWFMPCHGMEGVRAWAPMNEIIACVLLIPGISK